MIQINFEYNTEYGVYRDALWLPDGHTYTDAEILAMQEERVNNWISLVAPPAEEGV